MPGFRVMRWEERDGRFRLTHEWPEISVATNGTHDTETSAAWWEALPEWERGAIRRIPQIGGVPEDLAREAMRLAAQKLPIKTRFITRGDQR